jgi:diguanylate cyclase (GGDEF)-like protein/PAS domain S-box-containing protein
MYKNQVVDAIGLLNVSSLSDYGTLLWISTGFSYLIVFACFILLIYILITRYSFFKYQAILIILGISIQLFLSIFIIFAKDANASLVLRQMSPIIILFSDIIFVVGFSFFKVGEIIPINYRHIIEDIKDPIIVLDNNSKMNFVNNSAKKFFGIDDKYIGKLFENYWGDYKNLVLEEEKGGVKKDIEVNLLKNRIIYELNVSILGRNPGASYGKVLLFRDITDRKNTEERIKYLSFHDSLTGLYNRAYFDEELHRFDVARQLPLSVIIGDVNGLKVVNDSFGHLEGDKLLAASAKVLTGSCRNEDMISRWGGDEFMILLPKTDEEKAFAVIDRIQQNALKCKDSKIPVSIALGTATKKETGEDINDIINMAENQMYMQKIVDKNNTSNESMIKSGEDFYRTGGMTDASKEKMKKLLEFLSEP